MRRTRGTGWTLIIAILGSGCVAGSGPTADSLPAAGPMPTPASLIDHADGPTDVILRFDMGGGDLGICQLCGGWSSFTPGPEFTLYGDGSVVVRDVSSESMQPGGPVRRDGPFRYGRIGEAQIQSLLQDAADVGLLGPRDRYDLRTDNDDPTHSVFTIRAGGVDKRVEVYGPGGRFETFAAHLVSLDPDEALATAIWAPERYWGLLIEISSWIAVGVLDDVPLEARVPWPWPLIKPWAESPAEGRRVMARDERAIFDHSDDGGVIRHVFLVGPDHRTMYSYSQWPLLPEEMGSVQIP